MRYFIVYKWTHDILISFDTYREAYLAMQGLKEYGRAEFYEIRTLGGYGEDFFDE